MLLDNPATMTTEEILEAYATNKPSYWNPNWADHHINFKVGPATAELHSDVSRDGFRGLYSVNVKKKRRGQGHGRRLMDVIVAYAEATGTGMFLAAWADNEAAIRLYKSVGFRVSWTREARNDEFGRPLEAQLGMKRYPTRIPSTPEWDRHFEAKALRLERDHEPRLGSDHWVAFFDALYKAQMEDRVDLGRPRRTGSGNYDENTRRLSCDATGAQLAAAGWTITYNPEEDR